MVFAYGHDVAFAEQNIDRLMHRIGVHAGVDAFQPGRLNLLFHGWVTAQFGIRHQGQKRHHQLVGLRHVTMRVNQHVFAGFDAGCQIVDDELFGVLTDFLIRIVVGKYLIISNEYHRWYAQFR